ncbi:MAG: hypothetical protein EHM42_05515, partial [Planctomycetaceae bacterium]
MRPTRRLPEWMVVIAFALALLPGFVDVSGESAFAAQTGQEETPADAVPATADDESAVEPRADEVESANEAQPDLPPRPSLPQQDFEKSDRRAGEPEGPTDDDL